jgi:hypothetical protein
MEETSFELSTSVFKKETKGEGEPKIPSGIEVLGRLALPPDFSWKYNCPRNPDQCD